jgi:DNA-binding NtrC family response regulator
MRFLEDGEYEPAGGGEPRRADVRALAATETDLEAAVEAGRFREDLYYRLKVMTIELPPLRERAADIPALVAHFLVGPDGPRGAISREALRILVTHSWPGNVRELRSAVDHALVLSRGAAILPDHLPKHVIRGADRRPEEDEARVREWIERALEEGGEEGDAYQRIMDRFEAPLLAAVMERTEGNQVQAAKLLGIHRTTLRTKLKKHGI